MASSSSSFHSNPPSSSGYWNYDVFVSYRGIDTLMTFVDRLYSALVQRKIQTYKYNHALTRGEFIRQSLSKAAIEESHIAVIVFSENYADSSWCLQELAHIMKCKDERAQIVIPIFYHIDPSELRKQKGKYGEALAKHESVGKNVESWRKALVDAGNLSGYVVTGPETIFIKQIVETISNRLYASFFTDNEDLIGIEGRLQDLKSKMEMEPDGVLMVGIWGLGGGGKTTLASALYNEIFTKFDGSCFLKDVREESSKHGLPKLQKEILSLVLQQTEMEVNRVKDGRRLIKSRFHRKKVLIVLDDVDHLDQLKALAGSHDWFGEGSRIIITTRDNHLLNAHKVNVIYNISLLNNNEAYELFCKHALGHGRHIEEYQMLIKDMVSYAGGLPLALKVLGSFLCDKGMSEWMSALAKLKEIPDIDMVEKLKISYDGLNPVEKELFLDIACFFRGEEKDEAMVILDACGYHPMIGVEVLMQKGLITVSEEGRFDMHDLIQEMGHYIVQGENPRNPELRSRVWQEEDVAKICSMNATTVMLEEYDRIEALQVRFIWDREIPPSLPQVVGNMKKLRWISCLGYPATSLPREFQPMELCYLQLQWSLVEQLWEGYKILPNLKVLNLTNSRNLISTPDFDELPSLERLILRDCSSLEEIHPSIGYHERLIFLDMEACRSLKLFPPIFRMKKLETLILTGCFEFCKFPEIQTSMDNLVKLSLSWSGIEVVPSSIGQYCTNLCSLDLRYCYNLVRIEGNFHLLKHLKELYLEGCNQLTNLPTEGLFDVDNCLHLLSLSSTSFNNLQRGAVNEFLGFLPFISRLSLRECSLVDGDISVFCKELSNLQVLDLRENNFSQLHSSLSQLPRLKFLNLSDCYKLVEIPDLPSSLAILIAERCTSLNLVGDFPTNHLKWLWKVSLSASHCNGERVMQSMFQGNAIEDYFISFRFDGSCIPIRGCKSGTTLQLPWNWYDEFCGFLVYIDWHMYKDGVIIISDVSGRKNNDDDDEETITADGMCYISFGSLRNTSWWNSKHTTISFSMKGVSKVELVPRRSQGDNSIERAKDTTYHSEFWDEESSYKKTFEIIRDSRSSIEILFRNNLYEGMFDGM